MSRSKSNLVLASGSPRRKELLLQIGVDVEIIVPNITEIPQKHESPTAYIERNAREKNAAVKNLLQKRHRQDVIILAADTIVVCDDQILEKPSSHEDAEKMLTQLSGRSHDVLTSYCLADMNSNSPVTRCVKSVVHFRKLDAREIETYVLTGEPMDKAGAYGAQGRGSIFIERLEGSYSNVVGLPLFEVLEDLKHHFQWHPF